MDFYDYQFEVERQSKSIKDTKLEEVLLYGLADQAGQVLGSVKKNILGRPETKDMSERLGDVLWHVAAIAAYYGYSLQDIADSNIKKVEVLTNE